jgi:hypothetical protein
MTIRYIVGIIALVGVSICGLVAAFLNFEMIDKVNERLPADENLDWLGWHLAKYQRLNQEYKRLYPEGRLPSKIRVVMGIMFACLVACVWGFQNFPK